ncbi:MAG: glycosyltransferase [Actinomycetota bacterium]|nr:MAG: glycosyltransferase [Actinomycetota bacterium]
MRLSDQHRSLRFARFADSHSITVIIPARNEQHTIGTVVSRLIDRYATNSKCPAKIVVVDDHSTDDTALLAAESGATVLSRLGEDEPTGKAETIYEGIRQFPSDIYALFDADVPNFDPGWLELLCLVLEDDKHILAKGAYRRPVHNMSSNHERFLQGGRVTELVARPLLSLCFPELARFGQPLSGEVAFRSELAQNSPFSIGYGFDVALLIDSYLCYGIEAIEEVDLGERSHNHQDLSALSYQASQVALTILLKAGVEVEKLPGAGRLIRPGKEDKMVPFGLLR